MITIQNPDYTASKPRWESTINNMEKSSPEQQIFKMRERPMSDQPGPTNKPKAHREAVYPDMHWEVNREVNWQVWQHQENVFYSLEDSGSVWEDVECILRRVNYSRVSDPRRVFRQPFSVTGISDDRYRSNWDLWWLIQDYDGSDCDTFWSMSERRRELWVHLGVSLNQPGNYKQTLKNAWIVMDNHLEDCRRYLRLFGCTWAIEFPQQRI